MPAKKPASHQRDDSFHANSMDATIATVLQRLKQQDERGEAYHAENKAVLAAIREEVQKTNGRVTKLEAWRSFNAGRAAGISVIVSAITGAVAWIVTHLSFK